ncbi:hypothetical protein BDV28DRAFT_150954 [Aspergillus coremiiformis]|uniref:Uncharacterized protein n=1 Tax=Aspergillus coremiiformis TaxID=138285 RepID=A0A5N6YY91_9EURO|nr:hypothetical protein BDV28DRAFT_150954 [Aspergillus coremiiformis]
MNFVLLLFLVFFAPLLLLLAWLALSSCLGSGLRSRFTRDSLREGMDAYGRDYLRGMASSGPAMSEQIELENMLRDSDREE